LERLWAGWRGEYVSGALGSDRPALDDVAVAPGGDPSCVLCRIVAPGGDDRTAYVLWRGERVGAVLNAYPYGSGHLMVMPVRHVGELEDLDPEETAELWTGVTLAVRAIKTAYRPHGINLGVNLGRSAGAGIPGHLHVHALPRWDGDTNFMTTVAEARVLPETLSDSWEKLRAAWPPAAPPASPVSPPGS
jgi:ATP adenylyltransferase